MTLCALRSLFLITSAFGFIATARADGPADNNPETVRRIPKLGIDLTPTERDALNEALIAYGRAVAPLLKSQDAKVQELLPDVLIYGNAASTAYEFREFFDAKEVVAALELLAEGTQRAVDLAAGRAPWTTQTGLVVRGYRSKIDHSIQPYGMVIPPNYVPGPWRWRLDLWFHGRGETLSEVNFLQERRKKPGTFTPADGIVLHPYGRYSNANKFAGETDVFEALESVKRRYAIDEDRISVRGFSMGGASTWHLAVHYPTLWAAANPGAGFSETPEFLRTFQGETLNPTWYERKLWRWYDATDWAVNLYHCPTVAYSGEQDRQKQAADIMAAALRKQGLELTHVIGADTAHAYEPTARDEVEWRMSSIIKRGRHEQKNLFSADILYKPAETFTLKYNRFGNITIDALGAHWEAARVGWTATGVETKNVTAFTFDCAPGQQYTINPAYALGESGSFIIDEQPVPLPKLHRTDRGVFFRFHQVDGKWKLGALPYGELRKRHGLQGPIDDAFMDSFIFVRPTGTFRNAAVEAWSNAELERAIEHWRRHFRGRPRVKNDVDVTLEDIDDANLILWGDDQANAVWSRISVKLPIRYEGDKLTVGVGGAARSFDAAHHAPIMIYPNPQNSSRYIVTNSSFTFREYAYLNNARQVPMLPDWAIVDLHEPPGTVRPGRIAEADFFGELWEVKPPHVEKSE